MDPDRRTMREMLIDTPAIPGSRSPPHRNQALAACFDPVAAGFGACMGYFWRLSGLHFAVRFLSAGMFWLQAIPLFR